MSERRVQLDADEQNRLFQEARTTSNQANAEHGHHHDSGDESADETGVVSRGVPGDEPAAAADSGKFFSPCLEQEIIIWIMIGCAEYNTLLLYLPWRRYCLCS